MTQDVKTVTTDMTLRDHAAVLTALKNKPCGRPLITAEEKRHIVFRRRHGAEIRPVPSGG